jgi:hypothetical protein
MALEIVWRNPLPITKSKSTVERVTFDDISAVYTVCSADVTETFELILGGAA